MLTTKQELKQWMRNYELIKIDLRAAYYFRNQAAVDQLSKRLMTTESQIAQLNVRLEEERNANANNAVGSAISSDVEISDDSPLHLGSPDGYWSE